MAENDGNRAWYARPVFFVNDCESALRFYSYLGFREAWRYDENGAISAVQVNRDGAELILNKNPDRAGGHMPAAAAAIDICAVETARGLDDGSTLS